MPPHFPVEDNSYETKAWASATIDNLFADNHPISFEPCKALNFMIKEEIEQPKTLKPSMRSLSNLKAPNRISSATLNPARRSVSVLETNLFNRHQNDIKIRSHVSQSDITSPSPLLYSDSAPSLLISQTGSPASLSARLRLTLTPEKPYVNKKYALGLKEQEGVDIWKNTFQQYLNESKMLPHGQSPHLLHFILNELLTTEITYLDHLLIIKQMFMDPLIIAATTYPRPLVNIRDIQTIFSYIPQLISLSSTLVSRLKDAICTNENGETTGSLGKAFCDLEEEFDVYISYAANFSKQQRCILRADRSIVYRQLVQDSLRKKETNRMGLSDYMIAPVQRITRYGLLLKDLTKHSSSDSPDFVYIQRALKCQLALAHAMNDIQ